MYSVPRPGTICAGVLPLRIEGLQILTDGAALVEPVRPGVHRYSISQGERVAHEHGGGHRAPPGIGRHARDRLRGLSVAVDEPGAGRNNPERPVLAALELPAYLPLVIGAEQAGR